MNSNLQCRLGKYSAAAVLLALATFALTGCGDQDQFAAESNGGTSTDANNSQDEESKDPNADDSENAPDAVSGQACVFGSWIFDNDSFKALLENAGGNIVSVTGKAGVTFNDDWTSSTRYDEWTTVATQVGAVATMVRNGEDFGNFELTDDTSLSMTETELNSVLTMTVKAEGQPEITRTAPQQSSPLSHGAFTCHGDTMTIVSDGETSTLHRER